MLILLGRTLYIVLNASTHLSGVHCTSHQPSVPNVSTKLSGASVPILIFWQDTMRLKFWGCGAVFPWEINAENAADVQQRTQVYNCWRWSLDWTVFLSLCSRALWGCHFVFLKQWQCYTRAHQVKWPDWKIHRPVYCFALVIVWTENKNVTISDHFICFIWWWNGVGGLCFEGEN